PTPHILLSFPTRRSSDLAVIQWYWLQDTHKDLDQFNTIHERLIEAWKAGPGSRRLRQAGVIVNFSSLSGNLEDFMTVNYLRDTRSEEHTSELQSPYDLVC